MDATSYTLQILAMLLVAFLLGTAFGYILWSRYRRMYGELNTEHERLKGMHTELEKDHAGLRYKHDELDKQLHECQAKRRSLEADVAIWKGKFQRCEEEKAAESAVVMGAVASPPPNPDDLKLVEGIGPKIEKLLNDSGIWTFSQLATANSEQLRKILDEAGPNYRISDPATWARQAEMAAEGKWDALKKYQEELIGGRNVVS